MDHSDKANTTNQQISKSKYAYMHAKPHFSYLLSAYFNKLIHIRFILGFLYFLFVSFSHGQYFSGEITYMTSIIPDKGVELDTNILNADGMVSKYIITKGNYKNVYLDSNGQESYSYTYHNGSKRMYDYYISREYITYRDSRKGKSTNYGTKVIGDSIVYILGFPCYQVQRETDYGLVTTFYSDSIQVDYDSFKEHAVGNWYEEIRQVGGSITIKSITKFPTYISIREAIQIEERKVDKEEFKLPEIPTVASVQSLDLRVQLRPLNKLQIECYNKSIEKASKIKGRTTDYTIYLRFVLTESGETKFIEIYNPDRFGLGEIAMDIMKSCGLTFIPGRIGNVTVASEVFFPIEFRMN
ncbi:MAG: hypothetical protein AAGI25_20605 [Bacteroidota bacterium]